MFDPGGWVPRDTAVGGQRVRRQGTYLLAINSNYFYFHAWRIDSSNFSRFEGGPGGEYIFVPTQYA